MNKTTKISISLIVSTLLTSSINAKDVASLDTVTVTAQKTQEDLQKVSASISVFNEFDIEDKHIQKVSDFTNYVPNFMSFQAAGLNGNNNPTSRGISALAQAAMVAVPIVIDGVSLSSGMGYDMSLLDIESIEILRGPQGTLYGAGAEAGAINIVTKKPSNETRAKILAEFGSDNKRQFTLTASGPVVKNKFYVGLAAQSYEKDGYIKNLNSGNTMNDKDKQYGRLNLRYTPTENLEISLISTKSDQDNGSNNMNLLRQPREVYSNVEGYTRSDIITHALKVEYRWDKYILESITAQRNYDMEFQHDFDYTMATKFHQTKSNYTDTISQELRLNKQDNKFSWLIGVYADDEESGFNARQDKATPNGLIKYQGIQDLTSQSLGVFAHSEYAISPKISLVTGIRYDKVDVTLEEKAKNVDMENSYKELSPKISLEYKINNNMMTYATIARGFNPGGFNPHSTDSSKKSFGSEELISYEMGIKSAFLDNRIILNSAIFYMDLEHLQTVHYISPTEFYMSNIATGTSQGLEFELKARATDNITLFANYGYTDATFDEFRDSQGDYARNMKPYAPKYNYSIGGQYRADNGIYVRADVVGYGKMYTDNANKHARDAYELVNAKIGYEMDNFDIYLYGKNIFDKNYDIHGFSSRFTIYSDPRELGVQLAYRF